MGSNSELQRYNIYPMLHFHRKFSSSITIDNIRTMGGEAHSHNGSCIYCRKSNGNSIEFSLSTQIRSGIKLLQLNSYSSLTATLRKKVYYCP